MKLYNIYFILFSNIPAHIYIYIYIDNENEFDFDHVPIIPLPWILFLPIIICVRLTLMFYSLMTKLHFVKPVTTKDIVIALQMYRWGMSDLEHRAKTYKTDLKQNKNFNNVDNNKNSENGIYDSIINFLRILTFTNDIEIRPVGFCWLDKYFIEEFICNFFL